MDPKLMEWLERFKISAATAAEAAGKMADTAAQKASGFVEVTKLNLSVFDLNTDVEMLMREIGRDVYRTHKGQEVEAQGIEQKLAEIDEKYAQIAALRGEISQRKNSLKCKNCGKECDKSDAFCSSCGAPV